MYDIMDVDPKEERRFFSRFVSDNDTYVEQLLLAYFWIAEYITGKYTRLGFNRDLLLDTAYDALLEAASDYAYYLPEVRFGAYAAREISQRISGVLAAESVVQHRLRGSTDVLLRARSAANRVSNNLKNDPTDWRAAKALGLDETELMDLIYGTDTEKTDPGPSRLDSVVESSSRFSRKLINRASSAINDILNAYEREK